MSDHHRRGDSPLYGSGPGSPYPPLLGDPYGSARDPYGTRYPGPYATQHLPARPPADDAQAYGSGAAEEEPLLRVRCCPTCLTIVHPDRLADYDRDQAAQDAEEERGLPLPDEAVDLTKWDHLVENTPKDAPYSPDADLPAASQGWAAR